MRPPRPRPGKAFRSKVEERLSAQIHAAEVTASNRVDNQARMIAADVSALNVRMDAQNGENDDTFKAIRRSVDTANVTADCAAARVAELVD